MKWGPEAGDVGVIGRIGYINRNALFSIGFFFPNVTANGYASAAQNIEAELGVEMPKYIVAKNLPDEINEGDWVTVDILASDNGVIYATNTQALL